MEKLKIINLAKAKPNLMEEVFFYDHPPIYKRIEMAKAYERV